MHIILLTFSENKTPGFEVQRLPDTIDRDELEFEGPLPPICYFIVGGNEKGLFKINSLSHEISVSTRTLR